MFINYILAVTFASSVTAAIGSMLHLKRSEYVLPRSSSITRQQLILHGKPGQGYYTQMLIGTPPQKVIIVFAINLVAVYLYLRNALLALMSKSKIM